MTGPFIHLKWAGSGVDVTLNMADVAYMRRDSPENSTQVHMLDGSIVQVAEEPAEIAKEAEALIRANLSSIGGGPRF